MQTVLLGLAPARCEWFETVATLASAGSVPVDFIRCLSPEETVARLGSTQHHSALLVDEGTPGLDRDLLTSASNAGCPAIVVTAATPRRDWRALGAVEQLPAPFDGSTLLELLATLDPRPERPRSPATPTRRTSTWTSPLVTVIGPGGTGTSTVAMALARGCALDPAHGGRVALVDAALHASLTLLHDCADAVVGLLELVDAHRAATPELETVRQHLRPCTDHGYELLCGLRRHREWSALRPHATEAALLSLRRAYGILIADVDDDLENEEISGSFDIEDRNHLARHLTANADVVVVTGRTDLPGVARHLRLLIDLLDLGVDPTRLQPVLVDLTRSTIDRRRVAAEVLDAVADATGHTTLALPVVLGHRRDLCARQFDNRPSPRALVDAVTEPVRVRLAAHSPNTPVATTSRWRRPELVTPHLLGRAS